MLWQRSFAPVGLAQAASATSVIDALVRHAFIEERAAEQRWEKDGYALRWTLANDLELVFVVSCASLPSRWSKLGGVLRSEQPLTSPLHRPFTNASFN